MALTEANTTSDYRTPTSSSGGLKRTPRPSAKSQLLKNPDVLGHIVGFLLDDDFTSRDEGIEARKALLQVTLGCKSFYGPAMDRLWRSLESLLPLVLLIPGVEEADGTYCVGDIRTLNESFKAYSRRVRRLKISDSFSPSKPVDPTLYVLLSQALGKKALLPGLESLVITSLPTHFSWHSLPLLLPSNCLTTVEIIDSAVDNAWFGKFGISLLVSRTGSTLKRLILKHDSATVSPTLWNALPSFTGLEELELRLPQSTNMPDDILFRIGQKIEGLAHLTLDVHFPNHIMSPNALISPNLVDPGQEQPEPFGSLQTLDLINRMENSICQCYSIPALIQHLTSLTVQAPSSTTFDALPNLAEHLSQYRGLRRLSVYQPPNDPSTIYVDQVTPLLQQLNLEELLLGGVDFLGCREDESPATCLERMLMASRESAIPAPATLRHLRRLELGLSAANNHIGLEDLASLVACKAPGLQTLNISIDSSLTSTSTLSLPTFPGGVASESALRRLEVRDQRSSECAFTPQEYRRVAQYLDACFPNLEAVTVLAGGEDWVKIHWEFIDHLRSVYRQTRRLVEFL